MNVAHQLPAAPRELALFAGGGGGILAGVALGWRCVCAVEWEPAAADVLIARQDDGSLEPFPVWDDIRTFDGRPWRGHVDIISGGFPCQDISVAGKGAGLDGERSGLWREMARVVGEVRPRFVFVENSPALVVRGLDRVLADLAALGYDARWGVVSAADAGAPHRRERVWIVAADANRIRESQPQGCEPEQRRRAGNGGASVADTTGVGRNQGRPEPERGLRGSAAVVGSASMVNADSAQREGVQRPCGIAPQHADTGRPGWWSVEPNMGGMVDGLAAPVDIHGAAAAGNVGRVAPSVRGSGNGRRLKMLGNGQVPAAAVLAWQTLTAGWVETETPPG